MFENSFLISFIGFFIVLTPLIFFHELGHYFAAIKSVFNKTIGSNDLEIRLRFSSTFSNLISFI